jgi:hypothetical protein
VQPENAFWGLPKRDANERVLVRYNRRPNVGVERHEASSMAAGQPVTGAQPRCARIDVAAARNCSGALESEVELLKGGFRLHTRVAFPLDSQIGFRYVPDGYAK